MRTSISTSGPPNEVPAPTARRPVPRQRVPADRLPGGYLPALLLFGGGIALVSVLFFVFRVNAVVCFWAAYVLTRPLGASLGDLLSQPVSDGGIGFGTIATSVLFLVAIVGIVGTVSVRLRRGISAPTAA